MADTKAIANRIKSIRDTRKITNAMYLISSTKFRKARKSLEEVRPFFRKLREEIGDIIGSGLVQESRYLAPEPKDPEQEDTAPVKEICGILVITADRGLAGAYNQNVIRKALALIERYPDHELFVVGEYGRHYFSSHNIPYDTDFNYADAEPTLYLARMIAGYVMDRYDRGFLTRIHVIYTDFRNALSSEAIDIRLLPFDRHYFSESYQGGALEEFEYMPSPLEVMERCIPVYCIGMFYAILVYSFSCEQNDRMMAMDSANSNADKLLDELTIRYNHMRQNSITQEITEISASVKASQRHSYQ